LRMKRLHQTLSSSKLSSAINYPNTAKSKVQRPKGKKLLGKIQMLFKRKKLSKIKLIILK